MKSETLPSFWKDYAKLNAQIKRQARKVYQLWSENHFHPSLHFKCKINRKVCGRLEFHAQFAQSA